MALYAIGDLHLSLNSDKPMDIFGEKWHGYVDKIRAGFAPLHEDDVTVLCGDLSWGMSLEESLEDFLKVMPDYERVRTCSPNIPKCMYERAAETNMYIVAAPPMKQGRIELIRYFKEQSISFEYHRYGSISEVPPYE